MAKELKKTDPFHAVIEIKEGENGKPQFTSKIMAGREQIAQQQVPNAKPEDYPFEVSESADLFAFIMAGFHQAVALYKERKIVDDGGGTPVPKAEESEADEFAAAEAQAIAARKKFKKA